MTLPPEQDATVRKSYEVSFRDRKSDGWPGELERRQFTTAPAATKFAFQKNREPHNYAVWMKFPYGTQFAVTNQLGLVQI